LNVFDQVRNSHNETVTAERAIDEATDELLSAQEELRLARLRLERGLGTNLEVLTAQRDLTQARVDQALALVNFNKSQTQLLHDIGLISIDNVTSGHLVTTPGAR
jgi:OMF family outer membrane factor